MLVPTQVVTELEIEGSGSEPTRRKRHAQDPFGDVCLDAPLQHDNHVVEAMRRQQNVPLRDGARKEGVMNSLDSVARRELVRLGQVQQTQSRRARLVSGSSIEHR